MPSLSNAFNIAQRAGLLAPSRIPTLTLAMARWGPTFASPYAAAAIASPSRIALIDDRGSVSYLDLDQQSTELAKGLRQLGVQRGHRVALACRNHRDFVLATIAAAKLGAGVVYLNTGFARPQMNEVLLREQVDALIVDDDLLALVDRDRFMSPVVVSVTGRGTSAHDEPTVDDVRRDAPKRVALRGSLPIAPVLLTSGTTGTPKGAQRNARVDPSAATGIIDLIPYRHDDVMAITSPLFHAWGLAQLGLAATFGQTVVVADLFDAEATLAQLEQQQATVLAVVPAILQRLLNSPALDTTDLSALRIVASSGSALPIAVVEEWLERTGPNLYNLYGSTEVGQATLATPADLAVEPGTAGRPLPGSEVRILDPSGRPLPDGAVGRIFVGNGAQFEGYTGGGGKEVIDGLMSSGDVGYFDADGLLFVTGRADDMIVSGGENVFPQEVEDLLIGLPGIIDAAVVGVPDDDFGQRLAAHVVRAPGAKITAKQIRSAVGENLARHKVPRDVTFVKDLPRTTTGKLRRQDL